MVSISQATAIKLATAAAKMKANSLPRDNDKAFMARALVQATLPHRDPGNVPQWRRKNGRFTLTIRPHFDDANQARYPYGSIPRLLLFWMVTEAARTKSRRLELGRSLADFMRQVGLSPATGGGKRGDAQRLREQMMRLFRSQFSFEEAVPMPQRMRWVDMNIADAGKIWWSGSIPEQSNLFGSYILLGEAFFQAITTSPVPVDRQALQALRRSSMALDVYSWSTFRAYSLVLARCPKQFIPWHQLQGQFGASYNDPGNFRKAFKLALRKVAQFYPALRYQDGNGGLILLASAPAVPPKAGGKQSSIHGETVPPGSRPRVTLGGQIHKMGR